MKRLKSVTNRIILLIVVATLIPVILLGMKLVNIARDALTGAGFEATDAVVRSMETNIVVYSLYAVFIAFILGLFFAGSIIKPLRELSQAARKIAHGDFDVEMPKVSTQDEIGVLTRSFEEMAKELDRTYGYITETRDYLQNIIKSSPDAIVTSNMEGIIQEWSPGAEEIFGYRAREVIGRNAAELYPEDLRREREKWQEELRKGNTIRNKKTRIIGKDGEVVEVLISLSPLRDKNDNIIGSIGVSKDIRKLTELEKALKESEARYRTLVETMNEGMWVSDGEGKAIFCNQRLYEMLGHTPEDVLGRPITDFMEEESIGISSDELERWREGRRTSFESRLITKAGKKLDVKVSGTPLFDEDGRISGQFAVISDITARKRAEQELAMTTTQLATIFNSSPVGITLIDRDFRVKSINKAMEKLSGHSRLDVKNNHCYDFFGPGRVCDGCPVERVFETGEVHSQRTRDKHYVGNPYLEHIAAPVVDTDGNIVSAIKITRDITKEKELEEELKKSYMELQATYAELKELDQLKDEFFSSVSHELKTPLTSIYGSVDLINSLGDLPPEQEELVNLIEKSTTRLNLLIDDLLLMARGDEAIMRKQELEEFSFKELLDEVLSELESQVRTRELHIEKNVPEGLPPVFADRGQIQKVLSNLINNAIKFNRRGGKILIEAKKNNAKLEVSVEDTGIGIPEEDQRRIFRRFYRVEKGEAKRYPGTGIGLSLVEKIIKGHGGRIWVESEKGKGSKFIFTLPLSKEAE